MPQPLGPMRQTCSPRSSQSRRLVEQERRRGPAIAARSSSITTRPERSAAPKENASVRPIARIGSSASRVGPARSPSASTAPGAPWSPCSGSARRSAPSARSRPDCARSRGRRRARGWPLGAPGVPRAVEVAAAAALELEHRGADRLQEPAVVGDEDDGRVDLARGSSRATPASSMSRWLVGSSSNSRSGFEASALASEARVSSPPEKRRERAVELLVAEAEATQGGHRVVAPAIAAGVLEPRLGVGVGARASRPSRLPSVIRCLEPLQLGLDLERSSRVRSET